MLCHISKSLRYSLLVTLSVVFALIVFLPSSHATSIKDLQNLHGDVSKLVNRSRGLALAILKELKGIDESCRDSEGKLIEGKKTLARKILGRADALKISFENNAQQAEQLIDQFGKEFTKIQSPTTEEKEIRKNIDRFSADLDKYKGYVKKFFDRAVADFGSPMKPREGVFAGIVPSVQKAPGLRISGELSGAAGGSSYKRPHADPKTDLTSTDVNLRVAGTLSPSLLTQINFHGSRQNTIEQRKIALTNFGAGVNHALLEDINLRFNLDYNHYSNDADKTLNFGNFSIGGGASYQAQRVQANANFKYLSRSYGNNKNANYKILTLRPDLTFQAGKGSGNLGINFLKKTNEVEVIDHQEFSPFFRWEFSKGGPELNFVFQQFSHPNDDDSEQDNNRIKASFHNKKTNHSGRVMYGPEVALYIYPNAEENDFADYGFVFSQHLFGRKASIMSIRVVYRMYDDTLKYDFAQVTFRKSKRPLGSGFSWELNLAGRYYTESSDKDDPLRFSNVHAPHTLDYYQRMGWTKTTTGKLREVTFGPIIGAKFYFDTERDDAFENDIDYVWRNPRNTALGGVHLRTVILASPAFRIRAGGRYQMNFLYNAEPVRNYSLADVNASATYAVGPQLQIEARGNIHLTRADIKSDTDLDKTYFALLVRYLFDVIR